jgi:hypothetical protein
MPAFQGTQRIHSERAIDNAAREAADRIMRRIRDLLGGYAPMSPPAREIRRLRAAVVHDIGDCVRLQSKFQPRRRSSVERVVEKAGAQ